MNTIRNNILDEKALEVLASISPGATREQREAALAALELSSGITKSRDMMNEIILERLQEDVDRYRAATDKGVELFINDAVSRVENYASTQSFIQMCNEDWFKGLIMSEESKIKLAKALIEACYPYVQRSVPTLWKQLAIRDQEVIDKVRFTLEDVTG
jgi:hypothetical protein